LVCRCFASCLISKGQRAMLFHMYKLAELGWVRDASHSKCMEALSVQRFFHCLRNSKAFVLPWNSSALVSLVHFRQKCF
jgi:hypothetical protein